LGDRCVTEVRDSRFSSGTDKNVWLTGVSINGETRFSTTAHPLDISMYHVAGVEIVETVSDIP